MSDEVELATLPPELGGEDLATYADDEDEPSGPSWTAFLVLGVFTGVAFGAILVTLLRQREAEKKSLNGFGGYPMPYPQQYQLPPSQMVIPPINIYNNYGPAQGAGLLNQVAQGNNPVFAPKEQTNDQTVDPLDQSTDGIHAHQRMLMMDSTAVSSSPTMDSKQATVTLSSTQTSRLMKAVGDKPWLVQVRTIGPPGRYAFFSTDANTFSPGGAMAPANVVTVPSGHHDDIYLQPGQYLFAMGSTKGPADPAGDVVVSISGRIAEQR